MKKRGRPKLNVKKSKINIYIKEKTKERLKLFHEQYPVIPKGQLDDAVVNLGLRMFEEMDEQQIIMEFRRDNERD